MGRNNADFNESSGKFYTGLKGLGRQVHIHMEPNPNDNGATSLCGKGLDSDLTDYTGKPSNAVLQSSESPHHTDSRWEDSTFTEATCSTCISKARKIRGY